VVVILLQIEALGVLGQGIWKEFRSARSVDQLWNVKIAKMLGKDNILRATCLSPLKMIRRQRGDAPGSCFGQGGLGFIGPSASIKLAIVKLKIPDQLSMKA
jgi:hypothetical protein